jgi:pimeloyl-ACP methyl ester carboxylesterase
VILHGMLSNAGSMLSLTRALKAREHYRHIARYNLPSWKHRYTPQVLAKQTAKELASKTILPALSRGRLKTPLHLIGHSNGGYVCLLLAKELGPSIVSSVFTLATPKGLPLDYKVPGLFPRIFHLRGGVDGVPFGGMHNPGNGEWIVTFPDEGHRSLHSSADSNGVADLITLLAGRRDSPAFIDSSGLIHVWPHCAQDSSRRPLVTMETLPKLRVCDGMHDAYLDWLKSVGKIDTKSVDLRLAAYFFMRWRLTQQREDLEEELAQCRAYGRAAKNELESIEAENDSLQKRTRLFEKRFKEFLEAFKSECQCHLSQINDALTACAELAMGPNFGNREVAEINGLLEVAVASHRRLNQTVQGRTKLDPPTRRLL